MDTATTGNIPRPEHPRPQFRRPAWINLNGSWTFRSEPTRPGDLHPDRHREMAALGGFESAITVPFCPESRLSGVGDREFIGVIWYHRVIEVPAAWAGRRVLLHFGAVFYRAEIYVDGIYAGQHVGGSVSFAVEVTRFVKPGGSHHLTVAVTNDLWSGAQPSGKQSWRYRSYGCHYTRTTGIWQTVWLEAVDPCGLADVQIVADVEEGRLIVTPSFHRIAAGQRFEVAASLDGREVGRAGRAARDGIPFSVDIADSQLWEPESPVLYDLELRVTGDGAEVDRVSSYAGLRETHVEGNRVFLNGQPRYLKLVLDQGFYPDGIWTAPSDDALRRDIELALAAGFNGARLHQKVFEERFLYWADRLGYLLWGESPSWGLDLLDEGAPHRNFLAEWREIVRRDRNHPSIIAWTPFNETLSVREPRAHQRIHEDAYAVCKSLDPTRPVNDASGYVHHVTDLYTVHSYEQDPAKLGEQLADRPGAGPFRNHPDLDATYDGQPYLIDEFGGIKWDPRTQADAASGSGQNPVSWGYGQAPVSLEEFYERLEGLVRAVTAHGHICGWCYTQLTDVEQERNGIYFYDRSGKFEMERIRRIFSTSPDRSRFEWGHDL